jgi:O-antigen ligase
MARASAIPAAAPPSMAWTHAPLVALGMIIVIAIRLHEFVPLARYMAPALLATFGGLGILLMRTPALLRQEALRDPLTQLMLAYFGFMIITVPFALWPGLSVRSVQYMLPGVAMLIGIRLCGTRRVDLRFLATGFVFAAAAYALYVRTSGYMSLSGRLSAGTGMYDSNDMASIMAMTFPLAVGLARSERGVRRLLLAGAAVLVITVALASGSRGGMLGVLAGALVLALGMKGRFRVLALTGLAVGTLGLWTFSPTFHDRMSSLGNLDDDYNTTHEVGRKQVWERGRQYIRENPVLGVGVGNFPIAEGDYFAVKYYGTRGAKWSNAHNAYVQAYAELGLIGGSIFVLLLLYGGYHGLRLWLGVRSRDGPLLHEPQYLASLCAYAVAAIFLSHAYFMPLFAVLAITGLAARVAAQEAAGAASPAGAPALERLTPAQLRWLRSQAMVRTQGEA